MGSTDVAMHTARIVVDEFIMIISVKHFVTKYACLINVGQSDFAFQNAGPVNSLSYNQGRRHDPPVLVMK